MPAEVKILMRHLPKKGNYTLGSPERFQLSSSGFSSESAATDYGNKLKQALLVYGCNSGIGIDFTSGRPTLRFAKSITDKWKESGVQYIEHKDGLAVYSDDLPVMPMEMSAQATTELRTENFPENISIQFKNNTSLTPKTRLALELYNSSKFEAAAKIRFLTLITIMEVLSERKGKHSSIVNEVNTLKEIIKAKPIPENDKQWLCNGLGQLKKDKIKEACHNLVREQIGDGEADYFSECYKIRSEILHDGNTDKVLSVDIGRLDTIVQKTALSIINQ